MSFFCIDTHKATLAYLLLIAFIFSWISSLCIHHKLKEIENQEEPLTSEDYEYIHFKAN